MNLICLLDMAVEAMGETESVVSGDVRLSYAGLRSVAAVLARRIRASGATSVALLDVSTAAFPIALFAAALSGVPFVPLNYRLTRVEQESLIERLVPAVLIVGDDNAEVFGERHDLTVIRRSDVLGLIDSDDASRHDADWPSDGDEPAVLLFTSGTTGAPKAAVLRHRHLVSYVINSVEFMAAAGLESALVSVPPYHVAGVSAVLSSIYAGRRLVQLPAFDPREWLELAAREQITHAFLVPTMLSRIVAEMEANKIAAPASLRAIAYGGGKMPLAVIERAMELFPVTTDFTNAYGLTETSSTIALLSPNQHRKASLSEVPEVRKRLSSVGQVLPSIEIEVRDLQNQKLGTNEVGEIYVRGAQVAGEYVASGSQLDSHGWFRTRDAGYLDSEGYLFLEGRIDDIIVRGGENISPGEIEDVLREHRAVADVAIVGQPDVEWGERIVAAVVLKHEHRASDIELQEWVKTRLRSSRVPQVVHFAAELPYNEGGKLERRKVREHFRGALAR
jgi:acyl-CoA synthetase (AMP-forming)/AMP-acid ligase II